MEKKKLISLNEEDLLKIEQIIIDRDKDGALDIIKEVVKNTAVQISYVVIPAPCHSHESGNPCTGRA